MGLGFSVGSRTRGQGFGVKDLGLMVFESSVPSLKI
jgi:hypothetical protein